MSAVSLSAQLPLLQGLPQNQGGRLLGWQVQSTFFDVTVEKVVRLFLRVATVLTFAGGIGFGLAGLLGAMAWSASLALFLTCVVATAGMAWLSNRLSEQGSPQYLVRMREESSQMSLEQIIQRHGCENLFRWKLLTPSQFKEKYRQQISSKNLAEVIDFYEKLAEHLKNVRNIAAMYQIPAPRERKSHWRQETRELSFEQILQNYNIEKLEKYGVVEVGEINNIKELKRDYDVLSRLKVTRSTLIDQEYESAVSPAKAHFDTQISQADRIYHEHFSVRDLQAFELRCVRERQSIQDVHDQRKREAKARFDTAVASFTRNGEISLDRLDQAQQALYQLKHNEYLAVVAQADREFRSQVSAIEARHIAERSMRVREEGAARILRDQTKQAAQQAFDSATVFARATRNARLVPIENNFKSCVGDLNQRYRAYLRIAGAV